MHKRVQPINLIYIFVMSTKHINNDLKNKIMTTLEEIKEICSREDNYGMSESEYRINAKYWDMLYWAWENWEDSVTKPYWEGDEKPEDPTESFKEDYFEDFDFDVEFDLDAE